jgi:hypothetical protein
MDLVTLESISPVTCKELLKTINSDGHFATLPSPVTPSPTTRRKKADEITTVLSNALTRMKIAQRNAAIGGVHVASSWLDMLSMTERQIIHDLIFALTKELNVCLGVNIRRHLIVIIDVEIHECFERLLEKFESNNLVLHDIEKEREFLDTIQMRKCSSFFPVFVEHVKAAPFMIDNHVDIDACKKKILNIIENTFRNT